MLRRKKNRNFIFNFAGPSLLPLRVFATRVKDQRASFSYCLMYQRVSLAASCLEELVQVHSLLLGTATNTPGGYSTPAWRWEVQVLLPAARKYTA
jgi:hypothetical protein